MVIAGIVRNLVDERNAFLVSIAVTIALVLSYTSRLDRTDITRAASRVALLGETVRKVVGL